METGSKYNTCCGKVICSGCVHAVEMRDNGVGLCPFCRTPTPTLLEEDIKRRKKRVEAGDAGAIYNTGVCYSKGLFGLPQDREKALNLWQQAGELGNAEAYNNIGYAYRNGLGVERDDKKANHYYELAAIGGYATARHNLGNAECRAGNWDRVSSTGSFQRGEGTMTLSRASSGFI